MPSLIGRWRESIDTLAPGTDAARVLDAGADLLARWTQPHRRYHTARHLEEVLVALDALDGALTTDEQALASVAGFAHDAVYDVSAPAGENERDSARLARRTLTDLGLRAGQVDTVVDLIEMTIDHTPSQAEPMRDCFHDADLWILAAPPARFDEYCAQVRQEYAAVPGDAYAIGRAAILQPLLEREHLYRTDFARTEWTKAARANVHRELGRLRA